ncbi:riboflavin synthase [Candidatus Woesearchaeota archaeon]|nr:riboflavin synthase [Candidatus Woesearchaeota archaeon]
MPIKIGVADTTFAVIDMFASVEKAINDAQEKVVVTRVTVPGIKDLPVACLKLLKTCECDIVIALGMPGKEVIDKQCAHEASIGIQHAMLLAEKHILEVFVHMDEGKDAKDLISIAKNRAYKHTLNALALATGKSLSRNAGKGIRQGRQDVGSIDKKEGKR